MNNKLFKGIAIAFIIVCLSALLLKTVYKATAETPPSPAVIELEKEMARDVPIYNDVAPRLGKNRAALEALGYAFDDNTLKAVPLAQ